MVDERNCMHKDTEYSKNFEYFCRRKLILSYELDT